MNFSVSCTVSCNCQHCLDTFLLQPKHIVSLCFPQPLSTLLKIFKIQTLRLCGKERKRLLPLRTSWLCKALSFPIAVITLCSLEAGLLPCICLFLHSFCTIHFLQLFHTTSQNKYNSLYLLVGLRSVRQIWGNVVCILSVLVPRNYGRHTKTFSYCGLLINWLFIKHFTTVDLISFVCLTNWCPQMRPLWDPYNSFQHNNGLVVFPFI